MFVKQKKYPLIIAVFIIILCSFANARQLSDFVLKNKKEGWYPTGVPMIRYNTDDGFGYGIRTVIYNNGYAEEPYFNFSPYFHMFSIQLFQTTQGKREFTLKTDMPYFRKTRMRVFTSFSYAEEQNANYFGSGPESMRLTGKDGKEYLDYEDYKKEFLIGYGSGGEYYKYNKYSIMRPDMDLYGYYEIFDDIKIMAGLRFRYTWVDPWGGRSFDIDDDRNNTHLSDVVSAPTLIEELGIQDQDGWINTVKTGIGYDTRDYEPDPGDGIFTDAAIVAATGIIGSEYEYLRLTLCFRWYKTIVRDVTLAMRAAATTVSGSVPFHELGYFSFLTEDQSALGNSRTLRGYRSQRFAGRSMTNANAEIRWECIDLVAMKQRFALKIIAFCDTGSVFNSMEESIDTWNNYRTGYGGGLAVTWNQAFVLHLYAGFSREDRSISVDAGHAI